MMTEVRLKQEESYNVDSYWEILRPLSIKAKLKLVTMLTTAVLEEENRKEDNTSARRIAKVVRHVTNSPTDAELQARFAGKEMPEQPEDPEWKQVITSNIGKTIKPIEKWL